MYVETLQCPSARSHWRILPNNNEYGIWLDRRALTSTYLVVMPDNIHGMEKEPGTAGHGPLSSYLHSHHVAKKAKEETQLQKKTQCVQKTPPPKKIIEHELAKNKPYATRFPENHFKRTSESRMRAETEV